VLQVVEVGEGVDRYLLQLRVVGDLHPLEGRVGHEGVLGHHDEVG